MVANGLKSQWRTVAALAGAGALFFTVGCASRDAGAVRAQELAAATAAPSGAPVVVGCEPGQRTLVRQAIVNGAQVSQVDCVTAAGQAAYAQGPAMGQQPMTVPVSYGYTPQAAARPVYGDYGDAEIVPARTPARVARPVRTRQVVYDERPVKKQRSVKKSAIIIGSSAGAGAGVGAAVGGKKGALIGALIGGGGAAVWDQVTRR